MVAFNTKKFNHNAQYRWPGYFEYKSAKIYSSNGKKSANIAHMIAQFDVYESIYSPTMSGSITLVDTSNLLSDFPILGEEMIEIVVSDNVATKTYKLRVYDINERTQIKHGVLGYVLRLCSDEYWGDAFIRVSKSYNRKKFEDNVKDILNGDMYLRSKKPLLVGETKDVRSIVVPYWSPIQAITWMGCRAQAADDKYRGGNFLFFETINGFNWIAVDNLLDPTQNKTYCELYYDPMRLSKEGKLVDDARTPKHLLRFETYEVVKTFNTLENARHGMYANTTRTIDLIEKKYTDTEFNYLKQFYDFNHLGGSNGMSSRPFCSWDHPAQYYPEAHLRVAVKRKNLFNDEPDGNSQVELWLPNKLSQMQQLDNFKIRGELPGHIGMTAGMIVDFKVPEIKDLSINPNITYDEKYSGSFLVSALRHKYQNERHLITVELVKDAIVYDTRNGM